MQLEHCTLSIVHVVPIAIYLLHVSSLLKAKQIWKGGSMTLNSVMVWLGTDRPDALPALPCPESHPTSMPLTHLHQRSLAGEKQLSL